MQRLNILHIPTQAGLSMSQGICGLADSMDGSKKLLVMLLGGACKHESTTRPSSCALKVPAGRPWGLAAYLKKQGLAQEHGT